MTEKEFIFFNLFGKFLKDWDGNIEGIDHNRLMNLMMSKEFFVYG